jgi:hypothetical protein
VLAILEKRLLRGSGRSFGHNWLSSKNCMRIVIRKLKLCQDSEIKKLKASKIMK